FFMWVNLLGLKASGKAEFVFTVLKVVPLLLLPLACLPFIDVSHFTPVVPNEAMHPLSALNAAAILTFWGFIGVETATTPAESVLNPHKTIPKAIIFGTLLVAFLYMASSAALMGVIPAQELAMSQAPFVDLTERLFGASSGKFIALCAVIVCIGTLNAWILTSGQVALGAAKDGFLPCILAKTNDHGAPSWAIVVSCVGVIPLLFFTLDRDLTAQLISIIDVSVAAFIYVYAICVLSYLKLEWKNKKVFPLLLGFLALSFCLWAIFVVDIITLISSLSIVLTGLPVYIYKQKGATCFQQSPNR
ncbi:MAG TPA: amino acid permease, partial [Alphaproteobacteria bacterium]|nr:amino acid permease [Alphaproteobacteria bacterium]